MASIYDNIPTLDLWYQGQNSQQVSDEPYKVAVPCVKQQRTNSNTVSFSTAPPAIYCYENRKKILERPVHRRNSSSEHVKELLKHYTNKLSRQLSNSSQTGYRRA